MFAEPSWTTRALRFLRDSVSTSSRGLASKSCCSRTFQSRCRSQSSPSTDRGLAFECPPLLPEAPSIFQVPACSQAQTSPVVSATYHRPGPRCPRCNGPRPATSVTKFHENDSDSAAVFKPMMYSLLRCWGTPNAAESSTRQCHSNPGRACRKAVSIQLKS